MKIGIIGAGNIGGTLTRRFAALGHEIFVANSRGPETLKDLAAETGATPVTVEQAAQAGDVVIVTIPLRNISSLPAGLFAKTATRQARGQSVQQHLRRTSLQTGAATRQPGAYRPTRRG